MKIQSLHWPQILVLSALIGACSWLPDTFRPAAEDSESVKVYPAPETVRAVRTAILISDDTSGYQLVAEEIQMRIPRANYRVFHLQGEPTRATEVLAAVDRYEADQIVAIGLLAATTGRERPELPLVFCRVFDYEGHDLISATSTGVQLLPPFDLQLQAWKTLSPDLKTIGVITGPGQKDLMREIESAAARHDIEIEKRTATSDRETLFEFKRLAAGVQGFIVLPDNRILSTSTILDLLSYGQKHDKQLLVFNDTLLKYGALMSVSSDDADVADQVIRSFQDSGSRRKAARPSMTPLTKMNVQLNSEVARSLGLPATSPEFQQFQVRD